MILQLCVQLQSPVGTNYTIFPLLSTAEKPALRLEFDIDPHLLIHYKILDLLFIFASHHEVNIAYLFSDIISHL